MHVSSGAFKHFLLSVYRSFFSLPHVKLHGEVCDPYRRKSSIGTRTLDLGCGKTPKNPFGATELYGIDVEYGVDEAAKIFPCDLGVQRLPFPDDHFDFVTAFDLFEHVPRLMYINGQRSYPFIQLMSEIFRVLKKDGLLFSDTPAYPRFSAFADPTHVNTITAETFKMYFCAPYNWAERYGFEGRFKLLNQSWCRENLLTLMSKE